MAYYKAGTVNVEQGSRKVTAVGTLFVSGSRIGHLWIGPDGLPYEITNIPSDTELTIDPPYRGATANGQSYRIAPTQDEVATAGRVMAELIGTFAVVRDTIGRGLIEVGSPAAPAIRFQADQDTGFYRPAENQLGLVTGGVTRFLLTSGESTLASAILSVGVTAALSGTGGQVHFRDDTATRRWASGIPNVGAATRYFVFDVVNNVEAISVLPGGRVGIGTLAPLSRLHVTSGVGEDAIRLSDGVNYTLLVRSGGSGVAAIGGNTGSAFALLSDNTERARIDVAGNLLVGASSGGNHRIAKLAAPNAGNPILSVEVAGGAAVGMFYSVSGGLGNAANAGLKIAADGVTGRGAASGGSFNANGQDYAEYMRKAGGCGVLAKGQVLGIDAKGKLTDKHSLAHSFVIKSTDPAYVGGDNWSPGPPPAEPVLALPAYDGPPEPPAPGAAPAALATVGDRVLEPTREAGEDDLAFIRRMAAWIVQDTAWVKAMDTRPAEVEALAIAETAHAAAEARFKVDLAAWQKATAAHAVDVAAAETRHATAVEEYRTDKAAWDARMEAARQCVDRVAFSGQVPCNVAAGTFKPGDYIVGAKGKNDEIVGLVVTNAAMRLTPGQRCDAVGKVWRIMEDGRAWVAVVIG